MATYRHPDRRNQHTTRPPRYDDVESDTEEEYDSRPRPAQSHSHRPPPPHNQPSYTGHSGPSGPPPPHNSRSGPAPPPPPPPPVGDFAPPSQQPHPLPRANPHIVVDDDRIPRPRPRAKSNVRLKSLSDEDSDDPYDRRGAPKNRRPRASGKDLERKNSVEHLQFREKRDGYLSDEGEMLKRDRRTRGARDDYYDDGEPHSRKSKGMLGALTSNLPFRSRRSNSEEPPPPPYPSNSFPHGRSGHDPEPDPRLQRRRTYREPERERPRYDDYDEAPRRRRTELYPPDQDRGYRSDHGGRRREDDYRRGEYERDANERRRREDGYKSDHGPRRKDFYGDRDDDRYRPDPRRRDRYDDDRYDRYDRSDRYDRDRRDRYRDSRNDYDRDGRRSRGRGGGNNWQKEAGELFVTYALPVLKKEGTKFVRNQLAKRGGGGS